MPDICEKGRIVQVIIQDDQLRRVGEARRKRMYRQLAELFSKCNMLCRCDILVPEDQDTMVHKPIVNSLMRFHIQHFFQIHTTNLRPQICP